jgi:hypothetical protein
MSLPKNIHKLMGLFRGLGMILIRKYIGDNLDLYIKINHDTLVLSVSAPC